MTEAHGIYRIQISGVQFPGLLPMGESLLIPLQLPAGIPGVDVQGRIIRESRSSFLSHFQGSSVIARKLMGRCAQQPTLLIVPVQLQFPVIVLRRFCSTSQIAQQGSTLLGSAIVNPISGTCNFHGFLQLLLRQDSTMLHHVMVQNTPGPQIGRRDLLPHPGKFLFRRQKILTAV